MQVGSGGKLRRGDPSGTVGGDGREVGVDDDDDDVAVDGLVGRKGESQTFTDFAESCKLPYHHYLVFWFHLCSG